MSASIDNYLMLAAALIISWTITGFVASLMTKLPRYVRYALWAWLLVSALNATYHLLEQRLYLNYWKHQSIADDTFLFLVNPFMLINGLVEAVGVFYRSLIN